MVLWAMSPSIAFVLIGLIHLIEIKQGFRLVVIKT
jgi:hypothetical protein